MPNVTQKKLKLAVPHVYVLLTIMVFIAAILTWVLPAGQFERVRDPVSGRLIAIPGSWCQIDQTPVGPFRAVQAIFDGMVDAADIIFFIFIDFAAIGLLLSSGAMHGMISGLLRSLKGKVRLVIIPVFLVIIGFGSSTIGMSEETIAFIPIFVGISIAMGYDAIIGCAIIALGTAVGYAGAFMNPFTVGVAQSIAELPPLSGSLYRILCHIVMIAITSIYMMRYALRVQADPQKSLVYGDDFSKIALDEKALAKEEFGIRQKLCFAVFGLTLVIFVLGVKFWDWYLGEISTIFLFMAGLISIIMGWNPNEFARRITRGLNEITMVCLMVGIARGIRVVMVQGNIIDTVVYGLSLPLQYFPQWLAAIFMLILQTLINFLIPSGSGQAAAVMPIMVPLADALGISRQVAVLAFQFGDGLSNALWPTASAVVMAGVAGVKVTAWWKWLIPLFLWLLLAQAVMVAIAVGMGY